MKNIYDNDIQALLFDFGNVLVDIDFNRALSVWASFAGLEKEDLLPLFSLLNEDHYKFERGEISSTVFFDCLRKSLSIAITDTQFLAGWNAIFIGEVLGICDVLNRAELKYPLYIFSNTNVPHQLIWHDLYPDLLSQFQKIFVSCDLGLRKPEDDAFHHVAKSIGKPIKEILFFDDTLENINSARSLGMPAVEVKSFKDVKDQLDFLLR